MTPTVIGIIVYVIVNIAVALLYVHDKNCAIKDKWRVPESALIIASLFGPFGAAIAMRAAHHKTHKPKFKLVYVFAVLHVVLIAIMVWKGYISF